MFHMTNDSGLFRTRAELEGDGWYPVASGRRRKGEGEMLPLYVGRMIQHYDHRAANVTVNEDNLHNAALSGAVSDEQKRDPDFVPTPQYWRSEEHTSELQSLMRISYAVFCLKKKKSTQDKDKHRLHTHQQRLQQKRNHHQNTHH